MNRNEKPVSVQQEHQVFDYLNESAILNFKDGTSVKPDVSELYRTVDIFAFHYGIGGCKSLSEFVEMVNQEDPEVISALLASISLRNKHSYSTQDLPEYKYENYTWTKGKSMDSKPDFNPQKELLINFLIDFGIPKDKIEEAKKKIASGSIKISRNDYSWINNETIRDPNFPVKEVMAQMRKDAENSINFKVSQKTLNRK